MYIHSNMSILGRAASSTNFPATQCFRPPFNYSRGRGLLLKAPKFKVRVSATYNEASFQPHDFGATSAAHSSVDNQPGKFGLSPLRGSWRRFICIWGSCLCQAGKVYVSHAFFKGKAGLILQPRAPKFTALDSGGIKLSKEGVVFVAFVPAIGTRQYDWNKKQVFALSVVELGTLLSLGPNESCEFFHDPSMGTSEEGKIRKVLKVGPMQDREGYSFILSVSNRILNVDDNFYVPITKGEFTVMRSAFNFILPHLMGWHAIVGSLKPEESAFSVW